VSLENLYNVLEYAYWLYVGKRYREIGVLSRFTTLQDLLPIINEELKKKGYLRALTLKEVFDALKQIELENLGEGKIWFRIPWNSFPGEKEPIPLEFYTPKYISLEKLKELGVPVDSKRGEKAYGEFKFITFRRIGFSRRGLLWRLRISVISM